MVLRRTGGAVFHVLSLYGICHPLIFMCIQVVQVHLENGVTKEKHTLSVYNGASYTSQNPGKMHRMIALRLLLKSCVLPIGWNRDELQQHFKEVRTYVRSPYV